MKAVEYTQYKVLPIITQVNAHLRSFRELLEYYNPTKEYNVQSAKPIVKPSATKCVEESVKKYQRVEIPLSPIRLKYGATRAFRLEEIEHTDPVLDEAKEIDWEYPDAGSNIPPDYFPENIDSEG
ncbi:hypothetical protein [Daejeonella sp.]|uniref:hypothetical protein n=1 Tax=Daejeonella sp. TaxID=2805397 RepID=UPI0030C49FC3